MSRNWLAAVQAVLEAYLEEVGSPVSCVLKRKGKKDFLRVSVFASVCKAIARPLQVPLFLYGCGMHFLLCMGVACISYFVWVWHAFLILYGCGMHFLLCMGVACISYFVWVWHAFLTLYGCGVHFLL